MSISHLRLPPIGVAPGGPCIFHAHEPFPSDDGVYKIDNEADSVSHCTHHLIRALFNILQYKHPHLNLRMKSEVTLVTEIIPGRDDDDDDDDGAPTIQAVCRVDQTLEASRKGTMDTFTFLPIEHKKPGTLTRSDWTRGFFDGTRRLYGNATECGSQSRKYVCATNVNTIVLYDSTAMVGIIFDYADYAKWNTREDLKVKIFFSDNIEEFLESLIAMADIGLKSCDFI